MKIEIWSDIMCPFCYIGKRHLEKALETFPGKDDVEIEWKSFQLDPTIPMDLGKETSVYDYLAARKGISMDQVKLMHERVSEMAEAWVCTMILIRLKSLIHSNPITSFNMRKTKAKAMPSKNAYSRPTLWRAKT